MLVALREVGFNNIQEKCNDNTDSKIALSHVCGACVSDLAFDEVDWCRGFW